VKFLPLLCALCFAGRVACGGPEEWLDRLDEALTVSAFDGALRARLSGTLEFEGYAYTKAPPGLIDATDGKLFNPRLTLFLDTQLGSRVYGFVQARYDRGFDPSDGGTEVRLDEYALRFTPWEDSRLNVQVGKFATVVGRWNERHLAWDNPFINAPFPYENVSAVSDLEPPLTAREFARTRISSKEKYDHLPIVWGPSYATGISVSGRLGKFDYAAEFKNAALSSRPEAWDLAERDFRQPTIGGRVGFRPNQAWTFGVSASHGAYLEREAEATLPRGRGLGDYHESVLAQDISFASHHLQIWAEVYEARFEVPHVGQADTVAYYLEAKYKFTPQLFGALRWNQQLFASVRDGESGLTPWGDDAWRIDAAIGYRFTAHTQLKLQYDFGHNDTGRDGFGHLFAAQFMVRF
jgi:hypothetical protein